VLEYKTDMHEKQKEFEQQQKINSMKRNPFNAKITQMSMQNATKAKERKLRQMQENTGMPDEAMDGMFDYEDMGGMDMLGDGGAGADIESKLMGEH